MNSTWNVVSFSTMIEGDSARDRLVIYVRAQQNSIVCLEDICLRINHLMLTLNIQYAITITVMIP